MVNQQKVIPMGRLFVVSVDIEGASVVENFEVIEIFNDTNPYPSLLGIDWAIDMNGVINLKKRKMLFERKSLWVIVPLDPAEGAHYTEPVCDYEESDDELDQIYKITMRDMDWINPMADGRIAWDWESSCTYESDEELEHWKNHLHELSTLRCNMMTKSLRCISLEVRKLPYYDGLIDVDLFLDDFECEFLEDHHFQALELALRAMPARWWVTHKDNFSG